jgi:hypothetical protein
MALEFPNQGDFSLAGQKSAEELKAQHRSALLAFQSADESQKTQLEALLAEAKTELDQFTESHKLLQAAPTLWFLCPHSDPRAAALKVPTAGGSCTRMGHPLSRRVVSVAHTFESNEIMMKILDDNKKATHPLWVAPLPTLYGDGALTIEVKEDLNASLLKRVLTIFDAQWVFPMGKTMIRFQTGLSKEKVCERAPTLRDDTGSALLSALRDDHGYEIWSDKPKEVAQPSLSAISSRLEGKDVFVSFSNIPVQTQTSLIRHIATKCCPQFQQLHVVSETGSRRASFKVPSLEVATTLCVKQFIKVGEAFWAISASNTHSAPQEVKQDFQDFSKHLFGPIDVDMEADNKLVEHEKAHEKEGWNVVAQRTSPSHQSPPKRNRGSRRGHGSRNSSL